MLKTRITIFWNILTTSSLGTSCRSCNTASSSKLEKSTCSSGLEVCDEKTHRFLLSESSQSRGAGLKVSVRYAPQTDGLTQSQPELVSRDEAQKFLSPDDREPVEIMVVQHSICETKP